MGFDQHICCSKEPSAVHGSQPPGNIAAQEAAQRYKNALLLNFLRSGKAGPLPRPARSNGGGRWTRSPSLIGRCSVGSKRSWRRPAGPGRCAGAGVAPADLRTLSVYRLEPQDENDRPGLATVRPPRGPVSASRSTGVSRRRSARARGGDRQIQVSCLAREDLLRWRRLATRMPWKGYADGDSSANGDA